MKFYPQLQALPPPKVRYPLSAVERVRLLLAVGRDAASLRILPLPPLLLLLLLLHALKSKLRQGKPSSAKRATAAAAAAAVSETPRRRTRSSSGASVDIAAETAAKESKKTKQGGAASRSGNTSTPRRRTRSTSCDDGMEVDEAAATTTTDPPAADTATAVAKRAAVLSPVAEHVDEKEKKGTDGTRSSEKEEHKTPKQKKGSASASTKKSPKKSTRTSKKEEEAEEDTIVAGDDVEMADAVADAKGGTTPSSSGKKTKRGSRGRGGKKTVGENTGATSTATPKRAKTITPDASQASAAVAQPQKQIDVAVHRIRHLNYIPRGINRLASTPLPPPSLTADTSSSSNNKDGLYASSYIATAREGGAVELLAVDQKWRGVATVPGLRNREVDALTWICWSRLVVAMIADGSDGGGDSDEDTAATANTKGTETTYSCTSHKESEWIHSTRRLFGASRDGTVFEIDFRTQRHSHVTPSGGGGVFCLESLCPECVCSNSGSIGGGQHSAAVDISPQDVRMGRSRFIAPTVMMITTGVASSPSRDS